MLLNAKKAEDIFRKVKHLREEYNAYVIGGDSGVLRIEDLHAVVERMYGIKIIKTAVPFEGEHIRGLMERYDDHIKIRIRMKQTLDWLMPIHSPPVSLCLQARPMSTLRNAVF